MTKTPFRPFSSVTVRIRKRPAQTPFCIRQLPLIFVHWYPSQGGDHQFESGTGYQKSAGQSIVFGLFLLSWCPLFGAITSSMRPLVNSVVPDSLACEGLPCLLRASITAQARSGRSVYRQASG